MYIYVYTQNNYNFITQNKFIKWEFGFWVTRIPDKKRQIIQHNKGKSIQLNKME